MVDASMQNLPAVSSSESEVSVILDPAAITPEYFVKHYTEFIGRYIAHGSPSKDTMDTYRKLIDQFISWCVANGRHPLAITDYPMRVYRETLYNKNYQNDTIRSHLVAIRSFYHAAKMLNLVKANPCEDLDAPSAHTGELPIAAYSPAQLKEIRDVFSDMPNDFLRLRNTAILYLMGVEGMRNVEVQRACREDIDWSNNVIYVRGKGSRGRRDPIFPCNATMRYLKLYLDAIPKDKEVQKDGMLTPLILSAAHNHNLERISRVGIRWVMNKALEAANLKYPGLSCHVLRHSCGTNLYEQTKDLRLVQETLRHKDPAVTARYAHVVNRLQHRATSALAEMMDTAPKKETKDSAFQNISK